MYNRVLLSGWQGERNTLIKRSHNITIDLNTQPIYDAKQT